MNYLVEKTFANRGYTPEYLREINNPYYEELKDIDTLAARLKEIHDAGLPITIIPDFDMDGICAGDCGYGGMAELGFKVNLFIPNAAEGYGISAKTIDDVLAVYPDTKVIITCDTGISAVAAGERCKELGIEFLITDHHKQDVMVDAPIIVDPLRVDEEYPHPSICGAFVMYQVLQYYADMYGNYYIQNQIRRLRVFAGIGTISDTMSLLYENRQLVKDAIDILRFIYGDGSSDAVASISGCEVYKRAFWGLYYTLKACADAGIITKESDIDETFFGYYMAPMFNAAKRMDGDMHKVFGVFFDNTPAVHMDYVYKLNVERKNLEAREIRAILDRDQPYAPFIYFSDAKPGILGLLAMKLMKMSGMPTFVVVDEGDKVRSNRFHGSGRSPEWYPCFTRLGDVIGIAGHEHAFGCSIDNKTALTKFVSFLKTDINKVMSEVEIIEEVPDFVISTDWTADTGIDIPLFEEYLNEIVTYKPFGKDFPAPRIKFIFSARDVVEYKKLKGKHLKLCFGNGFDVLCWNQADLAYVADKDAIDPYCKHYIMGHLEFSEYKGEVSIQFVGDITPGCEAPEKSSEESSEDAPVFGKLSAYEAQILEAAAGNTDA